jgi:hypothetical protein
MQECHKKNHHRYTQIQIRQTSNGTSTNTGMITKKWAGVIINREHNDLIQRLLFKDGQKNKQMKK